MPEKNGGGGSEAERAKVLEFGCGSAGKVVRVKVLVIITWQKYKYRPIATVYVLCPIIKF